jgi:hypothetical protein
LARTESFVFKALTKSIIKLFELGFIKYERFFGSIAFCVAIKAKAVSGFNFLNKLNLASKRLRFVIIIEHRIMHRTAAYMGIAASWGGTMEQ